jgi:putative glutamine amidotransferase
LPNIAVATDEWYDLSSMASSHTPDERPRIGIPYRTLTEQLSGSEGKQRKYVSCVERAGGQAIPIELNLQSGDLERRAARLDGIVLPGSPADVNPKLYHSKLRPETAEADPARENTDLALLRHCFAEGKPVLAICYGVQILNVYLGGSLIQDIPSEVGSAIRHSWERRERGEPEPFHSVGVEPKSWMAEAVGGLRTQVNSSHHQSIREPGSGLQVVARASDGVIEGVEWTGGEKWVVGVQWHPERMADDAFARRLFEDLVLEAQKVAVRG